MLKNLRIAIFNWFAAGKLTLTTDKSQEYTSMSQSVYTLGGGAAGYSGITINPQGTPQMNLPINLTIKIASANGGTVVSVNSGDSGKEDLYIIAEDADFDRELGKIITMNKLKS